MVKKSDHDKGGFSAAGLFDAEFAKTVKESAAQIWLAGLGAFAKAQEEGSKAFESLVKEGTAQQHKTQSSAEQKFSDFASQMNTAAEEMGARASQQWGKLETIFEERTAKALKKLGVPSAEDVAELREQVEALTAQVSALGKKSRPSASTSPVRKSAAGKSAASKVSAKRAGRKTSAP